MDSVGVQVRGVPQLNWPFLKDYLERIWYILLEKQVEILVN
jgi:hypothetical protein